MATTRTLANKALVEGTTTTFVIQAGTGSPVPVISTDAAFLASIGGSYTPSTRTVVITPPNGIAAQIPLGELIFYHTIQTDEGPISVRTIVPFTIERALEDPAYDPNITSADLGTKYRGDGFTFTVPRPQKGYPESQPTVLSNDFTGTTFDPETGILTALEHQFDGTVGNRSVVIRWANSSSHVDFTVNITLANRTAGWNARSASQTFTAVGQYFQKRVDPADFGRPGSTYSARNLGNQTIFDNADINNMLLYGRPTQSGSRNIYIDVLGADGITNTIIYPLNVAPATVRVTDFKTLEAAGNTNPQDLTNDGTELLCSDALSSSIYNYLVSNQANVEANNQTDLLSKVLLAPTGIYIDKSSSNPEEHFRYIADNVAHMIFKLKETDKSIVDQYPLLQVENSHKVGGITLDSTYIYVVYRAPVNKVMKIHRESKIMTEYITGRHLPSGQYDLYGITFTTDKVLLSNLQGTHANSIIWVKKSDLSSSGIAVESIGHTVTPTVNTVFNIAASEIDKATTGNPNSMAFADTNNTLYIGSGTVLYGFEERTAGARDFYRKDATKDIDVSSLGVTSIGSTAFDGTGILMICNLGIFGVNLDGTAYPNRGNVTRATLDTLAGTGARNYNVAFHRPTNTTYFIVGRNGSTEVKAIYAFRGVQRAFGRFLGALRYTAGDISKAELQRGTEALAALIGDEIVSVASGSQTTSPYTFDYNTVRFQGATCDDDSLFLYDRLGRFAVAFDVATKTFDLTKSLPRSLINNEVNGVEQRNIQGWSIVYDGLGIRIGGGGPSGIFGFGFTIVPSEPDLLRGIDNNNTALWVARKDVLIDALDISGINAITT